MDSAKLAAIKDAIAGVELNFEPPNCDEILSMEEKFLLKGQVKNELNKDKDNIGKPIPLPNSGDYNNFNKVLAGVFGDRKAELTAANMSAFEVLLDDEYHVTIEHDGGCSVQTEADLDALRKEFQKSEEYKREETGGNPNWDYQPYVSNTLAQPSSDHSTSPTGQQAANRGASR